MTQQPSQPTPAALVRIMLALHTPDGKPPDGTLLERLYDVATLGLHISNRLSRLAGTLLLRLLGYKHPLGWPLDQELLVMTLYGLLHSGRIQTWRRFFSLVARHHVDSAVAGLTTQEVQSGTCTSWWLRLAPELQPQQPRVKVCWLYLHGGAFVAGHPLMYTSITCYWLRYLAARGIACEVLSVDYPLAPEHPFPEGLLAAVGAYQWLEGQLSSDTVLVVGGDSAGANLVFGALAHQRQQGTLRRRPTAALLLSPAVDLSPRAVFHQRHPLASLVSTPAAAAAGVYDYIPRDAMANNTHMYVQEHLSPCDPLISPAYTQDFSGLVGPGGLLVVAGGAETMRPDIHLFARRAAASGGCRVVYHEEMEEPHCYCCLDLPRLRHKCHPVLDMLITAVTMGDSS